MTLTINLEQIKQLIDVPTLIDEIEKGFTLYSEGKTNVPPVGFMHFDDPPGDVHIKYGSVTGDTHYVIKIASAFPENAKLGKAGNDGLMLVFSQQTGELTRILLDKSWLTDMRTAAAGAVAARHFAPSKVDQIGIVGTGVQARLQLQLLRDVVDCKRVAVWGRNRENAERMIEELGDWEIRRLDDLESLVRSSQLIVTTTPAKEPLIMADWVQAGTQITAVGSDDDGKQELDAQLLGKADVVVADAIVQCVQYGECASGIGEGTLAQGDIVELGDAIQHPDKGRISDKQITIVDLTGVAIQDIQIAMMVDRAIANHE